MNVAAAIAFSALAPFAIGSCQASTPDRASTAAALEAAIGRYETPGQGQVKSVDCRIDARGYVAPFRGAQGFRCAISYKNPNSGVWIGCFALVGRALYQVGGCFDPMRDLGEGKGRLLTPG